MKTVIWVLPRSKTFFIIGMMHIQCYIILTTILTLETSPLHDLQPFSLPFWVLELFVVTGSLSHFFLPIAHSSLIMVLSYTIPSVPGLLIPVPRSGCEN